VRESRLWHRLLGVDRTVVQRVEADPAGQVVVAHVRPVARARRRCGRCGGLAPWYDRGEGRRRWRGLDLGTVRVFLEADAPRVNCRRHGPTVIAVPWARHAAGHTRDFDDMVAWLAVACSKAAVTRLMRIAWRTVGSIIARVMADVDAVTDRLDGLTRMGVDEISYRRGQQYLTVVTNHDTGRLVWAAPGRDNATMHRFFDDLGPDRCARLTHVSADGAFWVSEVVPIRAPQAVLCADPFHLVKWANEALDDVRRRAWNTARHQSGGSSRGRRGYRLSRGDAQAVKKARWALWKNPDRLTGRQQSTLDWIATNHPHLHRAYLLKEGLRYVLTLTGQDAIDALDRWYGWTWRCRIPEMIALGRKIQRHRDTIEATLRHGLTNALAESVNAKIRLITRRAFGFRNVHALIALAMLSLGGYRPDLPGR
jgi:transposase